MQRDPLAVQNAAAPPPPPSEPPQHTWPTAPQGVPVEVFVQEPEEQVPLTPFAVHAAPAATHVRVVPPPASVPRGMQHPLVLHWLPAQHGWPGAPQAGAVEVLPPAPPAPPEPVALSLMLASALPATPPPPVAPPKPLAPPLPVTPPPPVAPPKPLAPPLPVAPPAPLPPEPLDELPPPHPASSKAASPADTPKAKTR